MKKNKKAKFEVKGPEGIEDGLMGMGRAIEAGGPWTHPEMDRIPEWKGADIRITSDFERNFNEPGYFDHDLTVRTRHAGPVTWFVFQMRDLFDGWLDWGNKYGFYELLAQAALEHLAANQPEPEDAKPLLRAMLTRAFLMLEVAKQEDCLLKGPFGCNILIKRMPNRCVTNYMKTRSTYTGLQKNIQ